MLGPETSRCSGGCCRDFTLPFSPEEMAWKARRAQSNPRTTEDWKKEVLKIAGMIIFLRFDKCEPGLRGPVDKILYHYTCKNFDPATNNCMDYEGRPKMCRDYPYTTSRKDGSCKYKGCTRRCSSLPDPVCEKDEEHEKLLGP